MASKSWAIITALAAQLETITVDNGYLTDVGNNVWTEEAQRTDENALGLMIYSEPIVGPDIDHRVVGKPVRDFSLLVEAAIGTDIDNACEQIHAVAEDIENCIEAYAKANAWAAIADVKQRMPPTVVDIAILDRPEGLAVIAMQARIATRYFR